MSAADLLILAVLAVMFVLAVRHCWKNRGKCCGDCSACRNCGTCGKKK